LTNQIGTELAAQRDHEVEQQRRRQLPTAVAAPPVAVVEVDGGRLNTRQSGCGPGVHQLQAKEDKVACLIGMAGQQHERDPQPQPPPSFLEPRRVQRLVQQIKSRSPLHDEEGEDAAVAGQPSRPAATEPWTGAPRPVLRTCVASMARSRKFGPMVAAEAQRRAFYAASRRAFVADGLKYNWTIWRGYFRDFEPITDFLHVLCYLYLAAYAVGGQESDRWLRYVRWLQACWRGQVGEVIEELTCAAATLGPLGEAEEVDEQDPRRVVREALVYLRNNRGRMDYPRHRRAGLPVTSSLVESLVGAFNARVKSPQQYWNRPGGAEPILQVRAAVLSEDGRLERFFAQRPGNPFRRPLAA
jgi:hypothetical protein